MPTTLDLSQRHTAVVTVELQEGVVGRESAFPELATHVEQVHLLGNVRRLLEAARAKGVPVVHCTATYREDRLGTGVNAPLLASMMARPGHMTSGQSSAQLMPELGVQPGDLLVPRSNGVAPFGQSGLDGALRALGVDTLVAVGVSINVAIFGLVIEAVGLGYRVVLPTDAVAGVPGDYAKDVLRHSLRFIAELTSVDAVLDGWRMPAQPT